MTKSEIIKKVKLLNLPKNSYVVYGSAPMAIVGIREANDIDLFVSTKLLNNLKNKGWKKLYKGPKDNPIVKNEFEAHDNWEFSKYSPTLKHLLANATFIEGIPFASLDEVKKWKMESKDPKFKKDVELINKYLENI